MEYSTSLIRTAGVVASILALASCSRQVDVKIGVAAPMTGPLAQMGKDIAHGAEVAVDELNSEHFMIHGKRAHFELVVEDDKASPDEGKTVARRLVDAGVAAVFGHLNSGVTIAAAPAYEAAGIPQLSVSTNPKYTRMGHKTAFRLTADDIEQGATLGRLITDKLRAKSLFLTDDKTLFGVGVSDEVERAAKAKGLGMRRESIDPQTPGFTALAQRIIDARADVVFFGGDVATGVPFLQALRKAGSKARFVAADAMCDPSAVKDAQGAADRNFFCTVAGVPPSWLSAGIDFTALYKAKFGAPGAYSTLAYDGIHILAQAMQEAGSVKPEAILQAMKTNSFDGKIQGPVEFDAKGDIKDGTVVIYESIGGQLVEQRGLL
jgi:branched-chain amino acid transport system substrate-binding protein